MSAKKKKETFVRMKFIMVVLCFYSAYMPKMDASCQGFLIDDDCRVVEKNSNLTLNFSLYQAASCANELKYVTVSRIKRSNSPEISRKYCQLFNKACVQENCVCDPSTQEYSTSRICNEIWQETWMLRAEFNNLTMIERNITVHVIEGSICKVDPTTTTPGNSTETLEPASHSDKKSLDKVHAALLAALLGTVLIIAVLVFLLFRTRRQYYKSRQLGEKRQPFEADGQAMPTSLGRIPEVSSFPENTDMQPSGACGLVQGNVLSDRDSFGGYTEITPSYDPRDPSRPHFKVAQSSGASDVYTDAYSSMEAYDRVKAVSSKTSRPPAAKFTNIGTLAARNVVVVSSKPGRKA